MTFLTFCHLSNYLTRNSELKPLNMIARAPVAAVMLPPEVVLFARNCSHQGSGLSLDDITATFRVQKLGTST